MNNLYIEMKQRHQAEFDAFPMFFAFTQESFDKGMKKLGLEPSDLREPDWRKQVCPITGGGFIRRSDAEKMQKMLVRHRTEIKEAIEADKSGDSFIYQMFRYELANHEYGYTQDAVDVLDTLGITYEMMEENPALKSGFLKACGELEA